MRTVIFARAPIPFTRTARLSPFHEACAEDGRGWLRLRVLLSFVQKQTGVSYDSYAVKITVDKPAVCKPATTRNISVVATTDMVYHATFQFEKAAGYYSHGFLWQVGVFVTRRGVPLRKVFRLLLSWPVCPVLAGFVYRVCKICHVYIYILYYIYMNFPRLVCSLFFYLLRRARQLTLARVRLWRGIDLNLSTGLCSGRFGCRTCFVGG